MNATRCLPELAAAQRHWPVPEISADRLPKPGMPGCFARARGDRIHCGIDLYAPAGTCVVSVESGRVLTTGEFTTPSGNSYWRATWHLVVEHDSGVICRYAELDRFDVVVGERVCGGQPLGSIGRVLDVARIDSTAPAYIQALGEAGIESMLHFEAFSTWPPELGAYSGGNVFADRLPPTVLDPTPILTAAAPPMRP